MVLSLRVFLLLVFLSFSVSGFCETRTIHVFVALCDNEHQGIVPVPAHLGDGKDPASNLYWGAAYGVKSYLKYKSENWELIQSIPAQTPILERLLFKHKTADVYLLADAYDGEKIKQCVVDFIEAADGQDIDYVTHDGSTLAFGGSASLVAYVGHDGLMDFDVDVAPTSNHSVKRDVMILACYSQEYFSPKMKKVGARPLLWTTHLMAPEAYTLEAAMQGWIGNKSGTEIEELAAQAYHKYQKCGMTGARNLFTTGY